MLACAAFLVLAPNPYLARTLLVMNAGSPTSLAVGAAYLKKRGAADKLLVHCQDSAESAAKETIPFPAFREGIEAPLRAYLSKHPKIDFIVLTKGVPIRIMGAPDLGVSGTQPSLDSYLAALDYDRTPGARKVTLTDTGFTGRAWANRFWNSKERFSHAKFGGYLVTRLDGYTLDEARMLVAWSTAAEEQRQTGQILLDACPSFGFADPAMQPLAISGDKSVGELPYNTYNADMQRSFNQLTTRRLPVRFDKGDEFVTGSDLMGYCSWGSNDSHFSPTNYGKLRFAPGGIAETAVSTSARTFLPTSGGQSLIADLVKARVTGAKGYCDEPLLQAVASPTILFDRYTRGWTLAESFFAASRFVGWEDIVIGDPICQPYGR